MSKFNVKSESPVKVTNLAGGRAHAESPELEFVSLLLTSFVQGQFYRSEGDTLDKIADLLDAGVAPEFAAKAAVYARDQFNMRSVSHVVAGELAHRVKSEEWMRPFVKNVIVRVDDMLEILGYYEGKYGRNPVPNALKRGIRDSFSKFDGYQLAKYRGESREIKLVDVVNLVHPEPTDRNREALEQLVEGKLRSTETWESKLTQAGQQAESDEDKAELKAGAWADLVRSRRIGYMALVRNLRNIIQDAPEVVAEASEMLVQPELVRKSRMLPFRFLSARDEIQKIGRQNQAGSAFNFLREFFRKAIQAAPAETAPSRGENVSRVLGALNQAADIALANVPRLEGKTLVVVDESGSMTWGVRGGAPMGVAHGKRPIDIASLFAAVVVKRNPDADLMMFANDARYMPFGAGIGLLDLQKQIESQAKSGGTNFNAIFDRARERYDRIIILSDMQGWMPGPHSVGGAPTGAFAKYRRRFDADPMVYSFDLQGYGTLMFPERNVFALAGFSEKVFDVMALLEQDREALVHEIESVKLA